jgi:hypothetical protein
MNVLFQPIVRPRLIYGIEEFSFPIHWKHPVTGYAEVRFCFFDMYVGVSIHYSTPEQIVHQTESRLNVLSRTQSVRA